MAWIGEHTLSKQEEQVALDTEFSLIHMLVNEAYCLHLLPLKWSKIDQIFLFSVQKFLLN